jgi:hypothetical protein
MPIPEGTRVVEYAPVPLDQRTERLEVVADDVTPQASFYRAVAMAVDERGRIYVLDSGEPRVVALDGDGSVRFIVGGEGQGPGELQVPSQIAVSGDHVVVSDIANGRLGIWDTDGAHVGDPHYQSARLRSTGLQGTSDGGLISRSLGRSDAGPVDVISSLSQEGSELVRFIELPQGKELTWRGGATPGNDDYFEGRLSGAVDDTRVNPVWAADRAGGVYASRADEYQILAYAPDGSVVWALRVAATAQPYPDAEVMKILARLNEDYDALTAGQFDWPERLPAIADLRVDGHGHLFVFPFDYAMRHGEEVPVDVYDRDGMRLFSGLMARRDTRWLAAHEDFVYWLATNPATDETTVARRRIVETF